MLERLRRDRARDTGTDRPSDTTTTTTDRRAAELEAEEHAARERADAPTREHRFHREPDDAGDARAGERHEARPARGAIDAGAMQAARRRQREEYGGVNWGAAFFGFLAAAGLAAILTAIISAAGATLTLGSGATVGEAAETIGLAGGIALLVALVVAYFAGGYVAGRMSRFDGVRQGLGVWLVALGVTVILAAAGALLGGEYNVLEQLNLPRVPVDEGTIATGAVIALAAAVVGSLLAAMAGGKTGERYHRKVDRLAIDR
jgi:hypothetical protein